MTTQETSARGSKAAKRRAAGPGICDDPIVLRYMAEIGRFPLLSVEEEQALARKYVETREMRYAQQLVNANLRFVVKIAQEFRGYRVPLLDLIQEGNLGLMAGVKRFDPTRGYRLVSYAVWWIRAYMRLAAMREFSLVRVGTTQAQRKLFFTLRAAIAEREVGAGRGAPLPPAELARRLGVREADVQMMETRLAARDTSLDQAIGDDPSLSRVDRLAADTPDAEEIVSRREVGALVRRGVREVTPGATPKQIYVLKHRLTADPPQTLQQIGKQLHVSRERVRQIEGALLTKVRARLQARGVHAAA
ncbi:MAG: RNA polymerase factor sigma-32 [Deltaproteobacteria bacterium]|nr:RNA polymerase factor sigma-32 [Deltaproteobacteria bacterium]